MGHQVIECGICKSWVMEGRNDWRCSNCEAYCGLSTGYEWMSKEELEEIECEEEGCCMTSNKRVIRVKYLPCTNTLPRRLKAYDCFNNQTIVSLYNDDNPHEELNQAYERAAKTLMNKMGWTGNILGGWLNNNEMVFLFINLETVKSLMEKNE